MGSSMIDFRERRHEEARAWKERSGGKVIGLFCCSVPEELIHAAGMLPVRLLGEHEDNSEADVFFPVNVCPYPKACFDQALKGKYDYLDGMVVPNVCDMVRAMFGQWFHMRPAIWVTLPRRSARPRSGPTGSGSSPKIGWHALQSFSSKTSSPRTGSPGDWKRRAPWRSPWLRT